MTFDKAPLVELIVELKWGHAALFQPHSIGTFAPQGFFSTGDPAQSEEFYSRFGNECFSNGLQRVERLIPPGFPTIPGQVACRYKAGDAPITNLLQVGPGVFTANGLPPYKSWNEFLPFFKSGYAALLKSRTASENTLPFSSVAIRYINAFGAEYLEAFNQSELLKQLGFDLRLPTPVSGEISDGANTQIVLNYTTNLKDGGKITLIVGSGQTPAGTAVVFDISITHEHVDAGSVEQCLSSAQAIIEKMFMESTAPLHHMMMIKEA